MRILTNIAFALLLVLMMTNCSGNSAKNETSEEKSEAMSEEQKAEQKIYDEVMSLHDELMPKMKDLFDLRKKLEAKVDSLEKNGISIDTIKKRIADLEAADKIMMDWMHNYSALPDSIPHDSVMHYYNYQKEKISKVKTSMLDALGNGKQYLDSIH